jgi:hypothetical protein
MKSQQPQKAPTARQKEYEALAAFIDFHEEGPEELARYLLHCGIDSEALDAAGGNVEAAILEHYRTPRGYDVDRVAYDLARWPRLLRWFASSKPRSGKSVRPRSASANPPIDALQIPMEIR